MRSLVVALLALSLMCSLCLAQCNICQALGNGFCPNGSGSTVGSTCQSCGTVMVTGCQACGGSSCYSSLAACNSACAPVASGVMVGVALYSSSTSCAGTVGTSLSYQLFEVNRCDNLHGTGFSLLVSGGPSGGGYTFKLFSNYECSASSPTITNFGPSASGSCTAFQSISVSLFTPTTTLSPVPMSGTFTQTACSSPTNPSVTCASIFSTSYTSTQTVYNFAWSGPTSSGTVYDKGLVAIRTTGGGSYGSCYGWINGLQLKIDCFTTSSATPRLEATYTCSGCVATTAATTPSTVSPTTGPGASAPCFHESTSFAYKAHNSRLFSLHDLPSECRVPHRVKRDGLAIVTACGPNPLRLTRDHLVFTLGSGLVAAGQLKVGDVLFADFEEKKHCPIMRITSETDQLYFGLNCLESVVLASNLKTSTFGTYHALPAAWMSWAGWALGIDRASQVGDWMASVASRIKLIG